MSKIKLKMRIGVKRILSVFLTLMLVQVGVPFTIFTAFAAEELKLNKGTSADLQDKVDAASDGDTIQIEGTIDMIGTVTINKNITLSGNGKLVRNVRHEGRLIKIESGKVTIKNIIIDGKGVDARNEAVSVGENCEFTMESSKIVNNIGEGIESHSVNGGGIYNNRGIVTINGGEISGNTSSRSGGGIYNNEGTVTINGTTISGNHSNSGGGIYNNEGTLTINGGEISENTAKPYGGGIVHSRGTLTINGATIIGNTATLGGGISVRSGTAIIRGKTISGNIVKAFGGGILIEGGEVTISEGAISGNTAKYCGGGICNRYGKVTISGGTISGNTANSGCGVYNGNGYSQRDSSHCYLTISGGTISGNTSDNGGGVYVQEGGKLNVKGATEIIDNGVNKSKNVEFGSENDYITVEGTLTGQIGVKQVFNKVAVKAVEGYKITQEDLSCFKADEENAHLSLVNNEIMCIKNKTEWGQMVQKKGATYYVNENGRASAEVIGNGKIWLNTKIDGSGSWCGVDNSNGLFKIGSRFYFQVIDDANVGKYYDRIGKEYREKIESGKLKIFLIGVTDPDGNEYTTLESDLICYVKIDPNWDKDKLRAIFINGEKTEEIAIEYVETIENPSNGDKFAKLIIKHFSPYAIYQAKSNEAEVAQVSSNNISVANNFATGDSVEYVYILGLWAASVIALAGIVVAKRKFNK